MIGRGETILRPAGLSPEFFIRKGLEDRQVMEQLMQTSKDGSQGAIAALMYELNVLSKFRQGGAWDAQRIGAYIIANIATMRPWRLDSTAPQQVSANQRA